MTEASEAGRLLHWMPIVVRSSGLSVRERAFVASMIRQSRGRGFEATAKQVAWMRAIVGRFQRANLRESGPQLIDGASNALD